MYDTPFAFKKFKKGNKSGIPLMAFMIVIPDKAPIAGRQKRSAATRLPVLISAQQFQAGLRPGVADAGFGHHLRHGRSIKLTGHLTMDRADAVLRDEILDRQAELVVGDPACENHAGIGALSLVLRTLNG